MPAVGCCRLLVLNAADFPTRGGSVVVFPWVACSVHFCFYRQPLRRETRRPGPGMLLMQMLIISWEQGDGSIPFFSFEMAPLPPCLPACLPAAGQQKEGVPLPGDHSTRFPMSSMAVLPATWSRNQALPSTPMLQLFPPLEQRERANQSSTDDTPQAKLSGKRTHRNWTGLGHGGHMPCRGTTAIGPSIQAGLI